MTRDTPNEPERAAPAATEASAANEASAASEAREPTRAAPRAAATRVASSTRPPGTAGPDKARARRARRLMLAVVLVLAAALGIGLLLIERGEDRTVTLTVAAGPRGSDSHALMREVSAVVRQHSETLRLNVRATSGSSRNMALLRQDRVDLATVRADTPMGGEVRAVADLFPDYFQIITGPGVFLPSVNAFAGTRIAIPPHGTDGNRAFHMLLDHYDVDADALRWRAMPFGRAARAVLNGEVDALFTVRSLRDGGLLGLFEDASLRRVRLGLTAIRQAEAIAVKRPFLAAASIPQGVYTGSNPTPPADTLTVSVTRVLVARAEVPEEVVRELSSILFGRKLDITVRFALASAIERPGGLGGVSTAPIHPGAQSWFDRDEPSFIQENAEPLALVVTVFSLMLSMLIGLRARLSSVQKNRLDAYNYDLLDLGEQARAATEPDELVAIRARHFAVLETVVRAFDTDEVTEEGFQSFSLLWEAVRRIIEDRRSELAPTSPAPADAAPTDAAPTSASLGPGVPRAGDAPRAAR